MSVITLLIVIAVVGFAVYLIGLVPMDDTFKKVFRAVAVFVLVLVVLIWTLGLLGVGTADIRLR